MSQSIRERDFFSYWFGFTRLREMKITIYYNTQIIVVLRDNIIILLFFFLEKNNGEIDLAIRE